MKKLRSIYSKHKDVVLYGIFGVLTTVVDYAVYLPLHNLMDMSAAVSNVSAWAAAVLFAFVTNKCFVFSSNDWSLKTLLSEFWKFTICRFGSGLIETAFLFITADLLSLNGNIMKPAISIVVVTFNYFASKLLVFKKS